MLFGLSNTLATFYRYVKKILSEKLDIIIIIYIDNIFIYTKNLGQIHAQAVQYVLQQLQKDKVLSNFKKCYFYTNKVRFIGFVVLAQSIQMEDEEIKAIGQYPKLWLIKDIQVFIEFANFYK